jgi:hypothetical protein
VHIFYKRRPLKIDYLWDIALSVCLDTSFHYMYYWKGIWEKVGKVIGMNAYTTNDEASH